MFHWFRREAIPVLQQTWDGWQEDDGFLMSAAMAYYGAFSLFPLCLVLISMLGLVMRFSEGAQDEQRQLLELVEQNAGPWLAGQLGQLLAGVTSSAGVGGPLGIITLLAAALGVFLQLDSCFDRIWRRQSDSAQGWLTAVRSALYGRLVAFLMLLSVGALLIVLLVANLVLVGVQSYVATLPAGTVAMHWARLGFSLVSTAILFTVVYRVLPKMPVRWQDALGGGLLVSVIWVLGQQVLTSLVIGKSYTAYGVVGTFIAVMIWLYYASAVLIVGAEFVQALCQRSAKNKAKPGAC